MTTDCLPTCQGTYVEYVRTELKITVSYQPFSDHFQGFGQVNPIC